MSLTRKAIRATLRDLLLAANTAAGARVFTNRSSRVWRGQLPAIVIYTTDDAASNYEAAPITYESSLRVAVELWTSKVDADELDDRLDDLIDQVELALLPRIPAITAAAGGNPRKSGYEGVQAGFDADGERILAGARLTLRFNYFLDPDYLQEGGLSPFTLAHVEHDLENGDDPDAVDDIHLPQ